MECEICSTKSSPETPFFCTSCARNALYNPRLAFASITIESDNLAQDVGSSTSSAETLSLLAPPTSSARWELEGLRTSTVQSQHNIETIRQNMNSLRQDIEVAKKRHAQLKTRIKDRRGALETIQQAVPGKRAEIVTHKERKIVKGHGTLKATAEKSKESRSFLAKEAASLYRLKHTTKVNRKGEKVECYFIGGLYIPDLRDINNLHAEELTTALTHLAHLVVLVSHYLAVRLPAEITTPHRAYPLPTITTPESSYIQEEISFPGSLHGSNNSPSSSRRDGDSRKTPGIRPLYINQKVQILASEDPSYYNRFIEGVALLAWNVAWLCRTQGISAGTETWYDICRIGKNMGQLLSTKPISRLDPTGTHGHGKGMYEQPDRQMGHLGQFSHDSAEFFLGDHHGRELIRGWRFSRHALIADYLRKTLAEEIASKEWEVLNPDDSDERGLEDALLSQSTDEFEREEPQELGEQA